MSGKAITLIGFSLVLIAAISSAYQENPGIAYKVTDSALNVISEALLTKLKSEVDENPFLIPDQNFYDSGSNYTLTAIELKLYKVPRSKFSFRPLDEISWSLKGIELSIFCSWGFIDYFHFVRFRDSGWANITIRGLSVDMTVRLGRNDTEKLTVEMTKCSASVDKVSLKIDGTKTEIIYRLLMKLGLVRGMIKKKTTRTVCDLVEKTIKNINDEQLATMPTKYPVFSKMGYGHSKLVFDFGLTTEPVVTENHLYMNHNGGFLLVGDPVDSLLEAPEISLPHSESMLSVAVTDYPFDSLFDALMRSDFSSIYLTPATFPDRSGSPLETTCGMQLICLGAFIPEIAERFPNRSLTMLMKFTKRPDLTIKKNSFTITSAQRMSFNITEPDTPVLSVQSSISLSGTAHITNNTLFGKLISLKLVFSSASSHFVENTAEFLKRLNQRTEDNLAFLVPLGNDILSGGFEIPTTYSDIGLRALNPELTFIPDNINFNVDFDLFRLQTARHNYSTEAPTIH